MIENESATFIGFGNMGAAIFDSVLKNNCFNKISIIDPDESKISRIENSSVIKYSKISKDITNSKYIWICVKPQLFSNVSNDLSKYLNPDQVIISIMAGITKKQIINETNHSKVIRIMPNTPAQISKGISVWNATDNITRSEKMAIEKSLNSFGKSIYVDKEDIINLSTALSGSGPGFFYRILESFIIAGENSGLEKDISRKLAIETFIGSAELLNSNNASPEELRVAVTSPGGTTEAGLNYLEEINIDNIITQTISKAVQRGNELSDESNK